MKAALWAAVCLLLGLLWFHSLTSWAPVTDDGAPVADDGWDDWGAADHDDGEGGSVKPP